VSASHPNDRAVGASAAASRSSAGDDAYRRLHRAIVECDIRPGERVSEDLLVERYGLGKAAVRAALVRLRHDGLLQSGPRRAHEVRPLSLRDGEEINAMRLILEPEAARWAARVRTAEQLATIEHAARTAARRDAADPPRAFIAANREFHTAIAEASGNGRLTASIVRLIDEGERVLFALLHLMPVGPRLGDEYLRIAAAIRDGDGERAAKHMYDVLLDGKGYFIEALEQLPMDTGT
jgi:DNA-binding GntR family transcriptional regulator